MKKRWKFKKRWKPKRVSKVEKSLESTSKVEKMLIGETRVKNWKKPSKVDKTVESWNRRIQINKSVQSLKSVEIRNKRWKLKWTRKLSCGWETRATRQHSKFTQKKLMMMISVLRRVQTNIQCVYYGYLQLEIRDLVSFVFELQVRIVVSTI